MPGQMGGAASPLPACANYGQRGRCPSRVVTNRRQRGWRPSPPSTSLQFSHIIICENWRLHISLEWMGGLPPLSYDADRYVGITGVSLSRFASRLGAAFGALRVESAAFYGIIASAAFCRRPLPAVSPEVNATACAFGRFKRIDRGYTLSSTTVEVSILGHVTGGKLPFRFRRQTVRIAGSPAFRFLRFRKPCAIG